MTVAVRNVSSQSIAAAMVKVVIVRLDQQTETRWMLQHNFDNPEQALAPSRQYLVSPFGVQVEPLQSGGALGSDTVELRELTAESASWKEVAIGVDSVLDGSGRLIGSDEAGCYRMFTDWLRADRDLARALLRLRQEGKKDSILETLRMTKIDQTKSTFATRDHYGHRWAQHAQRCERLLSVSGPEAVYHEAERLEKKGARQILR